MSTVGRVIGGRYEITGEIGRGGFAVVYQGRDTRLHNRLVAIKRLKSIHADDPETLAMFKEELRLTSKLQFRNIAQILDTVEEDGYFVVLEYVDGPDLRRILRHMRSVPPSVAAYIIHEVCGALDYAYDLRPPGESEPLCIIHRDVSPQNILVSSRGMVKLTDFGIARARDHGGDLTRVGVLKGNRWYMSPEQARNEELDRRSDLYSAGLVLYELLTGSKLYAATNDVELLELASRGGVEDARLEADGIAPELQPVLRRALRPEREQRYGTGEEMAQDLAVVIRDVRGLSAEMVNLVKRVKVESSKRGDTPAEPTTPHPAGRISNADAGQAPAVAEPSLAPDPQSDRSRPARRMDPGVRLFLAGLGAMTLLLAVSLLVSAAVNNTPPIGPAVRRLLPALFRTPPPVLCSTRTDIVTTPEGVRVRCCGKDLGKTPLPDIRLWVADGVAALEFAKQGFETLSCELDVVTGFLLNPESSLQVVRVAESAGSPRLRIDGTMWTSLHVSVVPEEASVFLDGVPLTLVAGRATARLSCGLHYLNVRCNGFAEHAETLDASGGGPLVESVSLQRETRVAAKDAEAETPTKLRVNIRASVGGQPSRGLRVYAVSMNGRERYLGETNPVGRLSAEIAPGQYRFRIEKPGAKPYTDSTVYRVSPSSVPNVEITAAFIQ